MVGTFLRIVDGTFCLTYTNLYLVFNMSMLPKNSFRTANKEAGGILKSMAMGIYNMLALVGETTIHCIIR